MAAEGVLWRGFFQAWQDKTMTAAGYLSSKARTGRVPREDGAQPLPEKLFLRVLRVIFVD
jgi:hypothetical protein